MRFKHLKVKKKYTCLKKEQIKIGISDVYKSKSAKINSACNYELQFKFKEHTIITKNMTYT